MIVLHRFALAGFGPAIEFLAEKLIGLRIRHADFPGRAALGRTAADAAKSRGRKANVAAT
jgi:hypothetical protein